MIKLQVPEGGNGVSFDGENYKADKKGIIMVPVDAVADLVKFHKFTIVAEVVEEKLVEVKAEEISAEENSNKKNK
jgi:chaperone required for assembly of F1-ATPase